MLKRHILIRFLAFGLVGAMLISDQAILYAAEADALPEEQELPEDTSEDAKESDMIPDYSSLESLQAEITAVIDDATMEAKITDLKDYSGSAIKKGSTITIQGSMTLLYPFNVQGFYEIKEGDQVDFYVNNVSGEDKITVETSYLNLVTAP